MSYVLPGMIALFLVWGLARRVDVYGAFIQGAESALPLILKILPCMAGMLAAISALRASGLLEGLSDVLKPLLLTLGIPEDLLPLILLRPFSGSGAMALLSDVYTLAGTDSYAGYAASVMLGSTETVFYAMALYFGAVGVKNTRYTLGVALFSTTVGVAAALVLSRLFL